MTDPSGEPKFTASQAAHHLGTFAMLLSATADRVDADSHKDGVQLRAVVRHACEDSGMNQRQLAPFLLFLRTNRRSLTALPRVGKLRWRAIHDGAAACRHAQLHPSP